MVYKSRQCKSQTMGHHVEQTLLIRYVIMSKRYECQPCQYIYKIDQEIIQLQYNFPVSVFCLDVIWLVPPSVAHINPPKSS